MIGPDDQRWFTIIIESESWCTCYSQSQWAGCSSALVRLLFLKGLHFKTGLNMSFSGDFLPRSPLQLTCHQWPGVIFQVYFRELSHRRLIGWQAWSLHWEGLCVCPPHPCPLWSIPVSDLSVNALACQGMTIKCHDPFLPLCPLWTLQPINFHSAFSKIPGLSLLPLITNTCTKDTQKHTHRSHLLNQRTHYKGKITWSAQITHSLWFCVMWFRTFHSWLNSDWSASCTGSEIVWIWFCTLR